MFRHNKSKKEFWKKPKKVGDLLDPFFFSMNMQNSLKIAHIKEIMSEVCGDEIADAIKIHDIDLKRLYVELLDISLLAKFEKFKTTLVDKINDKMGKKIVISIDFIENKGGMNG
jgi:hypothetical protein